MNRRPRSDAEIYEWHAATLEHIAKHGVKDRNRPRISENDPQAGWFRRRLIPKGPYVAARIWIEPGELDNETGEMLGPEKILCEVDGARRNAAQEWTWLAGNPISEDDYMAILAGAFALPREPDPAPVETVLEENPAAERNSDMPEEPAVPSSTVVPMF